MGTSLNLEESVVKLDISTFYSNANEMDLKFMISFIFIFQFNWLGSDKKRSNHQANSR